MQRHKTAFEDPGRAFNILGFNKIRGEVLNICEMPESFVLSDKNLNFKENVGLHLIGIFEPFCSASLQTQDTKLPNLKLPRIIPEI